MVESDMEMEGEGNRRGKEVQIFGIRNNGEWGTGSAVGREGEKRSSSNEKAVGYRKEEIR